MPAGAARGDPAAGRLLKSAGLPAAFRERLGPDGRGSSAPAPRPSRSVLPVPPRLAPPA